MQNKLSYSACWGSLITIFVGQKTPPALCLLFTVLSPPQHLAHLNCFHLAVTPFPSYSFAGLLIFRFAEIPGHRPAALLLLLYLGSPHDQQLRTTHVFSAAWWRVNNKMDLKSKQQVLSIYWWNSRNYIEETKTWYFISTYKNVLHSLNFQVLTTVPCIF